jgi:hypothetical protein
MRLAKSLAIAVLAAPAIALAQPSYYVREAPLAREELRECMYRDEDLTRRDTQIATERRLNDREGAAIARAASMLAEDLRRLDSTDVAAVAAHNARAAEHNRRVDAHNLRVNDQNAEAGAPEPRPGRHVGQLRHAVVLPARPGRDHHRTQRHRAVTIWRGAAG